MVRHVSSETLNCDVEIKQYRSFTIVTDHALYPEKRRQSSAASYRPDVMKKNVASGVTEEPLARL